MTKANRLLDLLQERIAAAPVKPGAPRRAAGAMDMIDREWHCRMIRHLSQRWGMQVLVTQATRGFLTIEALPDEKLVGLLADLHRGYECAMDGITLEEAGLIRP